MNISFITSGHDPFDDRIFYHMARSLASRNNVVTIISSCGYKSEIVNGIRFSCFEGLNISKRQKISEFISRLKVANSEIIICSEPLPVYAASKYRKKWQPDSKILYDITEWYPSKKNLCTYNKFVKWAHLIKLSVFNLWISSFADAFIFGEYYKSRPYRILFPRKQYIFIPYYPDLKYIERLSPELQPDILRLSFSGKLTDDKGYGNFISLVINLAELYPDITIEVKIIGWPDVCEKNNSKAEMPLKKNISATYYSKQSFIEYLNLIKDTDIFIDLRNDDFENSHSLPIKLFYYAAFERPVIFSDLKAIRKGIDISSFGYLVNPFDINAITGIIRNYLSDKNKYLSHCRSARKAIENKYQWSSIEPVFFDFILTVSE